MFRIFLPPVGLESTDRKLLLLLGAAFFIGQYDMTVLSLALPDLQESFSIAEQDLGKVIGAARLGALPAIFLALLSDRIGRHRGWGAGFLAAMGGLGSCCRWPGSLHCSAFSQRLS